MVEEGVCSLLFPSVLLASQLLSVLSRVLIGSGPKKRGVGNENGWEKGNGNAK